MAKSFQPAALAKALKEFEQLQVNHLTTLSSGSFKLDSWPAQRLVAFERLKEAMTLLDGENAQVDRDLIATLRVRLRRLLEMEQELASQAQVQQDSIALKLQTIRKGKKALKKYGLQNGRLGQPRYLSNRT